MVYGWNSKDEWTSDDDPESYKRKQDLTGPFFLNDIKKYSLMHGEQCYFENVEAYRVDYRALSKEQLRYYLFWRDRFWSGRMLTTCEGYLWILAHEIMIGRSEPVSTYLLLMQLWEERKIDLDDPSLFIEFLRDYAILYNLPLPTEDVFGCDKNEMLINNISSFSPYHFDNSVFADLCGGRGYSRTESDTFNRTMNIAMRHIYKVMKNEGADLFSMYSDNNIEVIHRLFVDYPLLSGTDVAVDSPNVYYSLSFRKFINEVAKYVSSLIKGLRPNDRPNILSPEILSMIDDVYFNRAGREPVFEPPNTVTTIKAIDRSYVSRGIHTAEQTLTSEQEDMETIVHTIIDRNRSYSFGNRGMTERNWSIYMDEPVQYVSSSYYNVSYDVMGLEQRLYYTYWRTNIMKGICLETDTGYIRMFTAELLTFSDDVGETLRILKLMLSSYGKTTGKFLSDIIREFSMINGLPMNDFKDIDPEVALCIAYKNLSNIPMVDLPANVIVSILDMDRKSADELDEITVRAFNQSIRLIDEARRELGVPGYLDYFNVMISNHYTYLQLSRDYEIPDDRRIYSRLELKRNSSLRGFLSQTLKLVDSYVRKANGKKVKITVPKYHGERSLRIIEKCVQKEIENSAKRAKEKKAIVLDYDAVSAADKDLRAVTDMISTEDEDEPAKDNVTAETHSDSGADDVWTNFISSLDGSLKEYLKATLNSAKESSAVAKKNKMTVSKADDLINTKAMDTVGDTVLENGCIVEDYADDIRTHLP